LALDKLTESEWYEISKQSVRNFNFNQTFFSEADQGINILQSLFQKSLQQIFILFVNIYILDYHGKSKYLS
jgi:hypothetical protein